jgi:hypothetical protein
VALGKAVLALSKHPFAALNQARQFLIERSQMATGGERRTLMRSP